MSDHRIMDAYERSVCQECGQPRNAEAEVERLREERDQARALLREVEDNCQHNGGYIPSGLRNRIHAASGEQA